FGLAASAAYESDTLSAGRTPGGSCPTLAKPKTEDALGFVRSSEPSSRLLSFARIEVPGRTVRTSSVAETTVAGPVATRFTCENPNCENNPVDSCRVPPGVLSSSTVCAGLQPLPWEIPMRLVVRVKEPPAADCTPKASIATLRPIWNASATPPALITMLP